MSYLRNYNFWTSFISKIVNIEDELLVEEIVYASKIVNKYHLKKAHYNLQDLCKELTKICFHAKFEFLEDKTKSNNDFEGNVKISSKQKLKNPESLKYIISNRLAYKLGRWQWNIGKSKFEKIIFQPPKISPKAFQKNSLPSHKKCALEIYQSLIATSLRSHNFLE